MSHLGINLCTPNSLLLYNIKISFLFYSDNRPSNIFVQKLGDGEGEVELSGARPVPAACTTVEMHEPPLLVDTRRLSRASKSSSCRARSDDLAV